MRYVLGPTFNHTVIVPDAPQPGQPVDMVASVLSVDATGVAVSFAAPSQPVNIPAEVRVYLAPVGSPLPGDADAWVASSYHVSAAQPAIDPAAGGTCSIPMPMVDPGDYFGQVVVGYPA